MDRKITLFLKKYKNIKGGRNWNYDWKVQMLIENLEDEKD